MQLELTPGGSWCKLADGHANTSYDNGGYHDRDHKAMEAASRSVRGDQFRMTAHSAQAEYRGEEYRRGEHHEHLVRQTENVSQSDVCGAQSPGEVVIEFVCELKQDDDEGEAYGRDRKDLEPLPQDVPVQNARDHASDAACCGG